MTLMVAFLFLSFKRENVTYNRYNKFYFLNKIIVNWKKTYKFILHLIVIDNHYAQKMEKRKF